MNKNWWYIIVLAALIVILGAISYYQEDSSVELSPDTGLPKNIKCDDLD
tara:strand:+ start:899 stop:1045 length:147 start_codon:yes stop_codon:yes gene_type:complete